MLEPKAIELISRSLRKAAVDDVKKLSEDGVITTKLTDVGIKEKYLNLYLLMHAQGVILRIPQFEKS